MWVFNLVDISLAKVVGCSICHVSHGSPISVGARDLRLEKKLNNLVDENHQPSTAARLPSPTKLVEDSFMTLKRSVLLLNIKTHGMRDDQQ